MNHPESYNKNLSKIIFQRFLKESMAYKTGLLLLLLTLTACVELHKIVAVSISAADWQRQRWREKLPDVGIPQPLAERLSPLSLTQLQYFATVLSNKKIDAAAAFDADQFCSSADLLCSQDVPYVPARIQGYGCSRCNNSVAVQNLHLFVDKKELRESGEITLPDLRSPTARKSFLPLELAERMPPLSSANLSQILTLLNIPRGSNMSRNVAIALEKCEEREEGGESRCSSSVEGMLEFVVSALGSDVELVTDSSIVGSGERVKVTRVARRENVNGKPPIACHIFVFPYSLVYCHYINGSETFDLQLEMVWNEQRVIRNATAVCHYFSNGGPEKDSACHAVYGDMFLWLAKD